MMLQPIIWPLRAIAGKDVQILQAGLPATQASKFFQPILMRQRPRRIGGLLAPDSPVNLPWNVIGQPNLTDTVYRAFPRPVHELRPYPPTYFRITGITRDTNSAILGNCVVDWFDSVTKTLIGTTTSDANGLFEFRSAGQPPNAYYLRCYLAGNPDVAGTTVNTLTGL